LFLLPGENKPKRNEKQTKIESSSVADLKVFALKELLV
jgi:hypothetical protein